jgi:hypothetical protein
MRMITVAHNPKQRQDHCKKNSLFDTSQFDDRRSSHRKVKFAVAFMADSS